jgi:adenine-specific DNA-methyltransferase
MAKRAATRSSTTAAPAANGEAAHSPALPATDFRHKAAKRKNNPPAKIAAEGTVPVIPRAHYAYNPHLPPVLRFDQRGTPDALPALLAEALRSHEPWLEWTTKREKKSFEVDPVALHIHERVSAQAILKVAARQDVTRDLFADPEQEYHDAVQFYKHDVDWSNRLILGDSLQVMSSLARREDLAGKVQMIYMDPPYGIKFASNFQPEVGKRDVKDKETDLTREPEMVRAYRDTWHLGIHSYLSYLRDRLVTARELLADTGSIFVQIGEENLHRVRTVLDEVFGAANSVSVVTVRKTASPSSTLDDGAFYLLWYARNAENLRFRPLHREKKCDEWARDTPGGSWRTEIAGTRRALTPDEKNDTNILPSGARVYALSKTTSAGAPAVSEPWEVFGREFKLKSDEHWKTGAVGRERLVKSDRIELGGRPWFTKFYDDGQFLRMNNVWEDTAGKSSESLYVVQTQTDIIERCMLMTTDPGDLVLDPTCGSGTTAYVAEQWGRRWITIDTSRVAIAIARQRLMTAKFDTYKVKGGAGVPPADDAPDRPSGLNPAAGFHYKTVPHITLKSIAQNVALDPIFAKYEPILEKALEACNAALKKVPKELKARLANKLAAKQKNEGKKAITDADRRRWLLPPDNREQPRTAEEKKRFTVDLTVPAWYHWEVPFDTDPDWPKDLQEAVTAYRTAWRAKMDAVNACIQASAEQEELVDQPLKAERVKGREIVRVTGPFSVEAVQPPEMALSDVVDLGESPERELGERGAGFSGAPDELDETFEVRLVEPKTNLEVANVAAYLDQMYRFLRADGVRFLGNQQMKWTRLDSLAEAGGTNPFHAEGRWVKVGEDDTDPDGRSTVAVAFGPQYGPVTAKMVVDMVREANIRGYEHLVLAGFSFDGAAQTAIDKSSHPKVKLHMAHIRPDINPGMNGLLKDPVQAGGGQLFTVFGQPRIRIDAAVGEYTVTMEGVDIYNPVDDSIVATGAAKVAAWFVDSDYDGVTFCITQAFFPDRTAWEKLARALNGKDGPIDAERFEAFSGTTSLPFPAGKHRTVAVKVIDPRGNEVMAVERLP